MSLDIEEKPWEIPNPNKVKLLGPVCVSYGHPNLEETERYLIDFGLVRDLEQELNGKRTICYRGYGVQPVVYIVQQTKEPIFQGVYFEVASTAELVKASNLEGSSEIKDFLYGGQVVDITDPSGMPFHVVWGMQKREYTPRENEIVPHNYPAATDEDIAAKPRRGEFHRLTYGAIPVHKLGHVGYIPSDLKASLRYYCMNFNIKPSDIYLLPSGEIFFIFMHIDLGKAYSDHHSFFLGKDDNLLRPGQPHHAAFEVESIDVQFIGHEFLEEKGYKPFWGVGRHVLGSQVYDYWFDLDGFLVEHYADGDLVNEDTPIHITVATPEHRQSNWGPLSPLLD